MLKKNALEQGLVGNDQWEGFSIDLMNELSDNLGFNYELKQVADSRHGTESDDGTWNGMIGEVVNGRADIATGDLTITKDRSEVVDFTVPTMNLGVSILFKKPEGKPTPLDLLHFDIEFGCPGRGSTRQFFNRSEIAAYKRLSMRMEENQSNFVRSGKEGVDKVKAGNFALLMESPTIEYNVQKDKELMQVGGLLNSKNYAMAVPLGSPLRRALNQGILRLQESGKLVQIKDKWWSPVNKAW